MAKNVAKNTAALDRENSMPAGKLLIIALFTHYVWFISTTELFA